MNGKPFIGGPKISAALARIAETLRKSNYLRGLPREEFAIRAADIMVALNGVHAFREGNGRTQRVFMRALAAQAGHDLNFSVVSRERMIQASIAGNEHDDTTMMRRMFNKISDPARVAALDRAVASLSRLGFPWNDHYIATMEKGHKVAVILAAIAGDQFMARTAGTILIGQASDLPTPLPKGGDTFIVEPSSWG